MRSFSQRLYRVEDSVVNNKATQTYRASMLQSLGDLGQGCGICWSGKRCHIHTVVTGNHEKLNLNIKAALCQV